MKSSLKLIPGLRNISLARCQDNTVVLPQRCEILCYVYYFINQYTVKINFRAFCFEQKHFSFIDYDFQPRGRECG
jgi:hypothetical protein